MQEEIIEGDSTLQFEKEKPMPQYSETQASQEMIEGPPAETDLQFCLLAILAKIIPIFL